MNSDRIRYRNNAALSVTLVAGAVFFAQFTSQFYRIWDWLIFRYVGYWLVTSFWLVSCLAFGNALLGTWFKRSLGKAEQLTLGLAVGVLAFGLAIFFVGLAHGLGTISFFAIPLLFLAYGAPALIEDGRILLRSMRRDPSARPSFDLPTFALCALGLLGIGILYFQILWPEVFSFDTRWYHTPIAQRYALTGAVSRFEEGFWQQAWPHLMSYLFTWAFLAPKTLLFDRMELSAHIEFLLFLATLAQIPVLLRRVLPNERVGLSWLALLAFPGIYMYDSNLHCDADHVAAFWAIPIALTLALAWRDFTPRKTALFGLMVGGAVLTKYSSLSLALAPSLALFGRGLWLLGKTRSMKVSFGLLALVGVALAVTAPHWLKNWIWFGDPMYPVLRKYFTVDPWSPDVPDAAKFLVVTARPGSFTKEGILEGLQAVATFSFIPNEWYVFHRNVPVIGSLFTLTTPCLLFLRGAKKIVWLYLLGMAGTFTWYMLTHYDRYLQAVLPWMAAATAGAVILIWRSGGLARIALFPLIFLQIAWGGDIPFFRTHNQINEGAVRHVAAFLASGFEKVEDRFKLYEPLTSVGRALPPDAVVLAHDMIMILGIDRNWVTDLHQSRISYGLRVSPRKIHDELRELGVTHIVRPDSSIERDTLAGDLAFLNYVENYLVDRRTVSNILIGRLPAEPPPEDRADYRVAVLGCGAPYRSGLYDLSQLRLPGIDPGPPPRPRAALKDLDQASKVADFVVVDHDCQRLVPPEPFSHALTRGSNRLYLKGKGR